MDISLKEKIRFDKYKNLSNIDNKTACILKKGIQEILEDAWGAFPDQFIEEHILHNAKTLVIARINAQCIGFCAVSFKNILHSNILYIEFLVTKKKFQKKGLGSKLIYLSLRKYIFDNIFKVIFKPLNLMFITPNIIILKEICKFASFVYPNPYFADKEGKILLADDKTWEMAKEIIKRSDNPNRKLNREGLVLEDSYARTPWLIYQNDNIPWSSDNTFNKFAKKYLGYGTGVDKEFIVRSKINFVSLIKYLFRVSTKRCQYLL